MIHFEVSYFFFWWITENTNLMGNVYYYSKAPSLAFIFRRLSLSNICRGYGSDGPSVESTFRWLTQAFLLVTIEWHAWCFASRSESTFDFTYPNRKKSSGLKREIIWSAKCCLNKSTDWRDVWKMAPSCWSQMLPRTRASISSIK